jgi:hypothetical protein
LRKTPVKIKMILGKTKFQRNVMYTAQKQNSPSRVDRRFE